MTLIKFIFQIYYKEPCTHIEDYLEKYCAFQVTNVQQMPFRLN